MVENLKAMNLEKMKMNNKKELIKSLNENVDNSLEEVIDDNDPLVKQIILDLIPE
ncbi:hypothetical protein HYD61_02315 [Mycoplasmopsis bovis]|nr:hypothetical protein [Mycoplasmopsis bovis]QQH21432.1 hypothetical protein HYE36_02225 [Mycoplasmopsis bovis]QQH23577.1 hypothetical protein HYE24_00930 [Mycoplasmopsis bovis]QQH26376.1 hypothetical protein HYE11_00920 [Mycoplasmopsis bovis]QQH28400.1 hypothetical protein HYE01_01000 [Mycoplasmopsis bovis]QQH36995.1 hypothetical protein HYD85_02320 [Mycoplasmopsis bovis]